MKTEGYRGIHVNKVCYPLDSPALAFMRGVQHYNGKCGCNKRTVVGVRKCGRVCFPTAASSKRLDSIFRDHITYGNHHHLLGPGHLETKELETDMVMEFLIEPLHVIELGVMNIFLLCWLGYNRYMVTPMIATT